MKPTKPTPIKDVVEIAKAADDGVNSFGLIPMSFDRGHDNEVVEVLRSMGFPIRGTF